MKSEEYKDYAVEMALRNGAKINFRLPHLRESDAKKALTHLKSWWRRFLNVQMPNGQLSAIRAGSVEYVIITPIIMQPPVPQPQPQKEEVANEG